MIKFLRSTFAEYRDTTPLEYGTFYGTVILPLFLLERNHCVTNSVTIAKQTRILFKSMSLADTLHTMHHFLCSTANQTTQIGDLLSEYLIMRSKKRGCFTKQTNTTYLLIVKKQ